MKKLFGFTLAEVLITMGIVGVIAAITTPTLVSNVKNRSYASILKSTVGDLENAFSMAIAAEKAGDLFSTSIMSHGEVTFGSAEQEAFVNDLRNYIKFGNYENISGSAYYTNKGAHLHLMNNNGGVGDIDDGQVGRYIPITLKNNAVMFIRTWANTDFAGAIWIDVNGATEPNIVGRDAFMFVLLDNGSLAPMGSREAQRVNGNGLWQDHCLVRPANSPLCTARLVENNYVFDY